MSETLDISLNLCFNVVVCSNNMSGDVEPAPLSPQAFWNWVENYPDEFTMLYQRPQTDMAGRDTCERSARDTFLTSGLATRGQYLSHILMTVSPN